MKFSLITMAILAMITACQSQDPSPANEQKSSFHEVVVAEVIHTSDYTYLLVTENDKEQWLAVPKMEAEVGQTYYYEEGMEMKNFESKELKRSFPSILFLEGISTEPKKAATKPLNELHKKKADTEKNEIEVEPAKDGITIAELFSKKEEYAEKVVAIRGQVTKFSEAIMGRNWIHLQDGTEFSGKFDLAITSDQTFTVGDTVTVEGKIFLNKDFGYGYFYDVIMEEAVKK